MRPRGQYLVGVQAAVIDCCKIGFHRIRSDRVSSNSTKTDFIEIDQIGFPESNIVTLNARRLLKFLSEHGKPVARELSAWLVEIESREAMEC